jgi:hypothetical protein
MRYQVGITAMGARIACQQLSREAWTDPTAAQPTHSHSHAPYVMRAIFIAAGSASVLPAANQLLTALQASQKRSLHR